MMDIVPLFKALADESRIKIVALITGRALSVEEIAAAVELTPATVSHHLGKLKLAGLVTARQEGLYTVYRFSQQPLFDALKRLAEQPAQEDVAAGLARYDRKVLGDYLQEGKLKAIPAQRKKREVVLRFLAEQFEPETRYSEREVNMIIADFHDDFATLRRELIMAQLLEREAGIYWRKESRQPQDAQIVL